MNRVFSDHVKLYLAKYRAVLQKIENERRNQLKLVEFNLLNEESNHER